MHVLEQLSFFKMIILMSHTVISWLLFLFFFLIYRIFLWQCVTIIFWLCAFLTTAFLSSLNVPLLLYKFLKELPYHFSVELSSVILQRTFKCHFCKIDCLQKNVAYLLSPLHLQPPTLHLILNIFSAYAV